MPTERKPDSSNNLTQIQEQLANINLTPENVTEKIAQEGTKLAKTPRKKPEQKKKKDKQDNPDQVLVTINYEDKNIPPLEIKKGAKFIIDDQKEGDLEKEREILGIKKTKGKDFLRIKIPLRDGKSKVIEVTPEQFIEDFQTSKQGDIKFIPSAERIAAHPGRIRKFESGRKEEDTSVTLKFEDGRLPFNPKKGDKFSFGGKKYEIFGIDEEGKEGVIRIKDIENDKVIIKIPQEEFIKEFDRNKIWFDVETERNKIVNTPNLELEKTQPTKEPQKDSAPRKHEASIEEIAELFKKYPINQIVLHAKENQEPEEGKGLTFEPDLDTKGALYILNELNKKNLGSTEGNKDHNTIYASDAVTSLIIKGGTEKNLTEKRDGIVVFIDVGGTWLEVTEQGKTKLVRIDHHGEGRSGQTSATEMMYKIMKQANLLKEDPPWLSEMKEIINNTDNLLYAGERDKNNDNKRIFNEKYFIEKWPYSIYAIAEDIPFEVFRKLVESGKVKNTSEPWGEDELKNGIGKIEWTEITHKKNEETGKLEEIRTIRTIAELCEEKAGAAKFTIEGLKKTDEACKKRGINTRNTKIGNIFLHDFDRDVNGKLIKIPYDMAYLGARALDRDGFFMYNDEDEDKNRPKKFFGNSKHPEFPKVIEEINKIVPGTINARDAFMFSPKDPKAMEHFNEKEFLEKLGVQNLEKAKFKETYQEKKARENKEIQKLYPELGNNVFEMADEDFKNMKVNDQKLKYKSGDRIKVGINGDKKEIYKVLKAKKGSYLLYKEGSIGKNGFQYVLSTDPREEINPELIVCTEQELEYWQNADTQKLDKEIQELEKKIKAMMGGEQIDNLDELEEFYKNIEENEELERALENGDEAEINRIQAEMFEKWKSEKNKNIVENPSLGIEEVEDEEPIIETEEAKKKPTGWFRNLFR